MHNYPDLDQEEPLTLNTCWPKVNQNRVIARSFFTFLLTSNITIQHTTLVVRHVFYVLQCFVVFNESFQI